MSDDARVYNVLFLCTGNSCRSILAEAILNRIGKGRFRAFSAGSFPKGEVNPHAIAVLKRLNHPTEGLRSKPWDEFALANNPDAPKLDFVFTVCDNAAGEVCPIWPGQPMTAHWGMADPGEVKGTDIEIALAFADTYRQLNSRLNIFTALPIASLDKLSLQQRMNAIGKTQDEPAHSE
ncbi:MAG: arsenate reductase ArsC [Hyphomonadaceae bacterium]